MSFRRAVDLDSLWPGEMKGLVVDAVKVLLINVGGNVLAYEDRCAHRAVQLSRGRLEREVLTCAAHEWQYNACTGAGINPRGVALRRFPVKIEEAQIWVDVAPAPAPEGQGDR